MRDAESTQSAQCDWRRCSLVCPAQSYMRQAIQGPQSGEELPKAETRKARKSRKNSLLGFREESIQRSRDQNEVKFNLRWLV